MTIEVSYGNSIEFKDTNTVTWSKSKANNCVVTVKADAHLNPCQTLLTGMKMNVSCEEVNPKDTICSAISKLQCQVNAIGDGSGTVTSVDAGDLNPLFTTAVANPTTDAVISFAAISQSANLFYASPDGVPGIPLFREIVNIDLAPNPDGTKFLRDDMTWQSIPAAIAEPITQIVYGTGPSVDSSSDWTYDVVTNQVTLHSRTSPAGESFIKNDEFFEVVSYLNSPPFEIFATISADSSGGSAQLLVEADDGVLQASASVLVESHLVTGEANIQFIFGKGSPNDTAILIAYVDRIELHGQDTTSEAQQLRFYEGDTAAGSNYFAVKGQDDIITTRTMQWPDDDPSAGEVLAVTSYVGNIITTEWASAGASISIGTIDSVAASANGAVISGTSLIMQSASGTVPGLVNTTTQTFAGDKTFSASTVSMNKNGTQVLSVGTTSFVFRTTNGGANVQAQAMFDPDNSVSVAGSQGFAFETANGLVFTAANGTRRIARAAIKLSDLVNTAGSEAGDLVFFTQSGGTAISQKFRLSALGNVVAGNEAALATTATDGFLYVPSCAGPPTGVPTAYTGKIAVVADSTNNKLYIYSGGSWVVLN